MSRWRPIVESSSLTLPGLPGPQKLELTKEGVKGKAVLKYSLQRGSPILTFYREEVNAVCLLDCRSSSLTRQEEKKRLLEGRREIPGA